VRRRVERAERRHRGLDDAADQPAPSGVDDPHGPPRRERDRRAVGHHRHDGEAGHRGDRGVGDLPTVVRRSRRHDDRAVHLVEPDPPRRIAESVDGGREPPPVLGDGTRVVTDVEGEVRGVVGRR
jgi:hypothetical protein